MVIITRRVRCTEMIDLLGRMWKERSRIFQGFSLVGGAGGEMGCQNVGVVEHVHRDME